MGVPQMRTEAATRRISFNTPQSVMIRLEVLPICRRSVYALSDTRNGFTYQENHGDVQSKRKGRVGK